MGAKQEVAQEEESLGQGDFATRKESPSMRHIVRDVRVMMEKKKLSNQEVEELYNRKLYSRNITQRSKRG